MTKPRSRPLILTKAQKAKFSEEYYKAADRHGGKEDVIQKWGLGTGTSGSGAVFNILQEVRLGANRRRWRDYSRTEQSQILGEYEAARNNEKSKVAESYGLMSRDVSSALGKFRSGRIKTAPKSITPEPRPPLTKLEPAAPTMVDGPNGMEEETLRMILDMVREQEITVEAAMKRLGIAPKKDGHRKKRHTGPKAPT